MRLLSWSGDRSSWWVRLGRNGPGLRVADRRRHEPLFSERMGYQRVLRLGPWSIAWLPRWRIR